MWKLGLRPRYSFSGNICFKFSAFCLCSVDWVHSRAAVMPRCPDPPTQVYQPCLPPLFTEVLSQVQQSCQDVLILQVRCTSHAYLPCGVKWGGSFSGATGMPRCPEPLTQVYTRHDNVTFSCLLLRPTVISMCPVCIPI